MRQMFSFSSLIFNESIGEDGLSSQSTYDVRIDNPHHIKAIAPNSKLLQESLPSNVDMKTSYQILVKAINEMKIQFSTKILSLLLIKMVVASILILWKYMQDKFVYLLMMWNFTNGPMKINLHIFGTVRIFVTLKFSSYQSKMQ